MASKDPSKPCESISVGCYLQFRRRFSSIVLCKISKVSWFSPIDEKTNDVKENRKHAVLVYFKGPLNLLACSFQECQRRANARGTSDIIFGTFSSGQLLWKAFVQEIWSYLLHLALLHSGCVSIMNINYLTLSCPRDLPLTSENVWR